MVPVKSSSPLSLDIIRTETTLSKYPIHNLSKGTPITIDIQTTDSHGRHIRWEVSANQKYGFPGQLAYKLDTLLINRRMEEAGQPIPEVIRLGSLRQICQHLGLSESSKNRTNIIHALQQNAFTGITACLQYKGRDKIERELKAAFTRYSVIFTGQKLPTGQAADGVYIVLSKTYREVLSHSFTRPLDYDYLKSLTPTAQRFYEIISYQIFAALKYNHPTARLRYSDYCLYSAQKRYHDLNAARRQMHKVHLPHLTSTYLAEISFQKSLDPQSIPDWLISYRPGPKAKAEYQVFSQKWACQRKRPSHRDESGQLELDSAPETTTSVEKLAFQQSFVFDMVSHVVERLKFPQPAPVKKR